jgi:hypothetical protein
MGLAVMARARFLPCPARDVGLGVSLSFLLPVPARTHINIAIVMDGGASPEIEIDKDLEKGPDSKSEISLFFFLEVLMARQDEGEEEVAWPQIPAQTQHEQNSGTSTYLVSVWVSVSRPVVEGEGINNQSGNDVPSPSRSLGDFDDSANALWSLYGKEAKNHDEAEIKTLKDDMDGVLIFVRIYYLPISGTVDRIDDILASGRFILRGSHIIRRTKDPGHR